MAPEPFPSISDQARGASADRNLLYAMMALRAGLLAADQLVATLHSWVDGKHAPIEQIMVQLGFISASDSDLLGPLVQAYLRRHGGEVREGLAALTPIGDLRSRLAAMQDDELDASLNHLRHGEGDAEPTIAHLPQQQRFRILSFYRQGGLGKVSIAIDNELGREVAFKEIREEFAHYQSSRERFLLEAEITGRLEHPFIVPVYGLGHFPDGRPFYAMRFVRGDTFKAAVRKLHDDCQSPSQRRGDLRRLLERFLDVCEAVEYAHARGVLHRDLKPGNIMLGRYGETLVVDWGLAKLLDRDRGNAETDEETLRPRFGSSAASMDGVAVGSPSYMSPEQAHGRLNELGPQTDVFGLGATLYYLLTGQAPYEADAEEDALTKAQRGVITPPSMLNSKTPPGLSSICMRALAYNKEERYESAAELREDIWQWLANEPVSAILATIQHFEALHAKQPDIPEFAIRLARELANVSKVYQSLERRQESLQAAERSVRLLDGLYAANQLRLSLFQELQLSRTQLSSVLRDLEREDEADGIDQANQDAIQRLVQAAAGDAATREELLGMTFHQGFSPEEAEKLLSEAAGEADARQAPTGGDEESGMRDGDTTVALDKMAQVKQTALPQGVDPQDRYELIEQLGRGGVGVVYRARDKFVPREVAVKIGRQIEGRQMGDAIASWFLREACVMALVDHPNAVPVYDAGYRKGTTEPFLVVKFIDGHGWTDIRRRPTYEEFRCDDLWLQLLQGFADICDAVHHAHVLGIAHGDPKPANVIVDVYGRAWLFDWGLSRVVHAEKLRNARQDALEAIDPVLRDLLFEDGPTGTVIGTPAFMSPEQVAGKGISEKTDIYVLGASLYFLLTGQPPFGGKGANASIQALFERIAAGEFVKPRELDPKIPSTIEQLCLRALESRPDARFEQAADLADAMRASLWKPSSR